MPTEEIDLVCRVAVKPEKRNQRRLPSWKGTASRPWPQRTRLQSRKAVSFKRWAQQNTLRYSGLSTSSTPSKFYWLLPVYKLTTSPVLPVSPNSQPWKKTLPKQVGFSHCWSGQQLCLCLGLTHGAVVINSRDGRNCQKRAYEVKGKKEKATVSVCLRSGPHDLESAGNNSLQSLHGVNNRNKLLEPQEGCRQGPGRAASQVASSL